MTSGADSDPAHKNVRTGEPTGPKAEMKVCHVAHMDAFQETDSADTHS